MTISAGLSSTSITAVGPADSDNQPAVVDDDVVAPGVLEVMQVRLISVVAGISTPSSAGTISAGQDG